MRTKTASHTWPVGRRAVLKAGLALTAYGLAAPAPIRALAEQPVKVGMVEPLTGAYAALAEAEVTGARLGIDEINHGGGVLGRPVELLVADSANDITAGVEKTRELIERDRVDFVTGNVNSAVALAMTKVTAEKRKLHIVTGAHIDEITGSLCSWNVFRICKSITMEVNAIADTLVEKFGKRWYFLTPDYIYGRSLRHWFGYAAVRTIVQVANQEKSLDPVVLARALQGYTLPADIALDANRAFFRDRDHELMSSFALGEARATENVTISDCYLTGGFALGTMLDGTFRRTDADAGQPTGRIKCGTESNGGFRNITISNCIFESCRGFALESVDGGPIEDVTFTGVTMRDIRNAPFFLRLGARLRGPAGTSVGTFKRVLISNIICDAPANDMPAIVAGIPGHPIEDVSVSDVLLVQKGGASAALADIDPPEQERVYPEPSSLGPLPARGLLVRHARNVEFHHIEITSIQTDARPFVWLSDVDGADFSRLSLSPRDEAPALRLREIRNLRVSGSRGLSDTFIDHVTDGRIP